MGVHPEPRIDLYWQQDRREGPLTFTSALYDS